MDLHSRKPTVNRVDSKDELFTEKRKRGRAHIVFRAAKLNIFAPLVNGQFSLFWMF